MYENCTGDTKWLITNWLPKARPTDRARGPRRSACPTCPYIIFLLSWFLAALYYSLFYALWASLNVSPLPELFGKPWFVAVARMNANKHSEPQFSNLTLFLILQWIIHLEAGYCLLLYNMQTCMRWKLTWINSMFFMHSSFRINVDVAFIFQCIRLVSILAGRVCVTEFLMIYITTNVLLGHICTWNRIIQNKHLLSFYFGLG